MGDPATAMSAPFLEICKPARVSAIVVLAVAAALWVAAPAGSRPVARVSAPRAGDWEAAGHGEASFGLTPLRLHGALRFEIRDATFSLDRRCNGSESGAIIVTRPTVLVTRADAFSYRQLRRTPGVGQVLETFSGRFVSRTAAIVRVREESDFDVPPLPASRCDTGSVVFHLRPAARRPVADGIYRGATASGEAVQVRVLQGGRMIGAAAGKNQLIPSVQIGVWTTTCGAQGCSSSGSDACARQLPDSIWIDAADTFKLAPTDVNPGVSGGFAGNKLSGTLSYPSDAQSCSASFTAVRG